MLYSCLLGRYPTSRGWVLCACFSMLVLIEFFHLLVADDEGVTYVSQEGVSALKTAVSVSQVLPDVMEARGGGC